MDSASQKTVTIIQSGQQATTYADFTDPLTPNGAYLSDIGDDFVWKSWLDDGTLWNFGLEYLDENVKYGMISGPPSSGVDI
jgi:hypothetical protein